MHPEIELRDTRDVEPEALVELFRHVAWARHRTRASVAAALPGTSLLLTGWHAERCVAMLRVLSDGVYRALIEDVIVHPDCRGYGHGRRLIEATLAHPKVQAVEVVFLFTDVPAFYARFGFRRVATGMVREMGVVHEQPTPTGVRRAVRRLRRAWRPGWRS
jgi:N-acetylglutamate synthase-like GNAT family acetyltransferase